VWYYVDGSFVETDSATVSITDRSFLYGDGCFEGVGIRAGRILHLAEHVARLCASARVLRIPLPVPAESLSGLLHETARRNNMHDVELGYLRPLLSRGSGYLGLRHTSRLERSHLYVIPQIEAAPAPNGVIPRVSTAAFSRLTTPRPSALDPRIKANNYLPHILALLEAQDKGADAAIHCDGDGFVTEAHAMNLFCVHDGRLSTPPETSVLAGITRSHILRIARAFGYAVDERPMTTYDLLTADEAFLTSSLDAIAALAMIEKVPLPPPVPGPVTSRLHREYLRAAIEAGTQIEPPGNSGPVDVIEAERSRE
jgi:branched-chain amino acid aminotransferase